jgi:hypothetical protein
MKNFKITLLSQTNPFKEGSTYWNILIDINVCVKNSNETTIFDMCVYNDLSPLYYKDLSPLVDLNLIKIKEL